MYFHGHKPWQNNLAHWMVYISQSIFSLTHTELGLSILGPNLEPQGKSTTEKSENYDLSWGNQAKRGWRFHYKLVLTYSLWKSTRWISLYFMCSDGIWRSIWGWISVHPRPWWERAWHYGTSKVHATNTWSFGTPSLWWTGAWHGDRAGDQN